MRPLQAPQVVQLGVRYAFGTGCLCGLQYWGHGVYETFSQWPFQIWGHGSKGYRDLERSSL